MGLAENENAVILEMIEVSARWCRHQNRRVFEVNCAGGRQSEVVIGVFIFSGSCRCEAALTWRRGGNQKQSARRASAVDEKEHRSQQQPGMWQSKGRASETLRSFCPRTPSTYPAFSVARPLRAIRDALARASPLRFELEIRRGVARSAPALYRMSNR